MKVPDNYRFRAGDVVTVRARVRFNQEDGDEEDGVHVELVGSAYTRTRLTRDLLVTLEGRVWEAGDVVRNVNDHEDVGEVRAFENGVAWVRLNTGAYASYPALDLEDVPLVKNPNVDPEAK
jgi:hypothetical protein